MTDNATPRPWRAEYDDNGFHVVLADGAPSPYIVATGGEGEVDRANAALIVRAVNAHDDLVRALKKIVNNWSDLHPKDFQQARAALAKAGAP